MNRDDLKQLLADAVTQVLSDQLSVEATASPSGSSQSPLNANRLRQLLMEVIQDKPSSEATTGPPKSKFAGVAEDEDCQRPLDAQVRTPPNSPCIAPSEPVAMGQLKELFETLLEQKSQSTSEGPGSGPAGPEQRGEEDKEKDNERVRASKVEYKTVNEVYADSHMMSWTSLTDVRSWDSKAYEYKIVDLPPTQDVSGLYAYVFVVRKRICKCDPVL